MTGHGSSRIPEKIEKIEKTENYELLGDADYQLDFARGAGGVLAAHLS